MKRFLTPLQLVVTLVMFVELATVFGVAAFPAVSLWLWASERMPFAGGNLRHAVADCLQPADAAASAGLVALHPRFIAVWRGQPQARRAGE